MGSCGTQAVAWLLVFYFSTEKESVVEKQIRRILIIKLRFHGDMLVTTPLISALKKQYPNALIDVLLYSDTAPILSENPLIDTLYGIAGKKNSLKEKVYNFLFIIKELRNKKYDLVINLTDQWIVAFIVRMLHSERKISQSFDHRQSDFWKNSFTEQVTPEGENVVPHTLSVLKPLGITKPVMETELYFTDSHWNTIKNRLIASGVNRQYVVIQPTARQIFKCWDNKKFAETIDALHQRGYYVILTSGTAPNEVEIVQEIAALCQHPPITSFAGKTHFLELGALIAHAALFIGVDSAPGHIAAAVKTPIISLFGATSHTFWRPWSENMIQLWAGNYQKMPARENLDRSKKYLSCIPSQDVIAATEKLLPKNANFINVRNLS